jgi:thiamine-phosphate pyrophosphorylase
MFRIILISTENLFPGEAELINQLMHRGDFNFHLRKKEAGEREIKKLLLRIDPAFYSRIVIHQHFDMEKEFSLGGIHLPESARTSYEELLKENHKIISTSVHDLKDVDALRKSYSYILFSPVFPSISKTNYIPTHSPEELREELKGVNNKSNLIALGGIDLNNINEAMTMGFGGAALLGSVWKNKNPVRYFSEVLKLSSGESR